MGFDRNTLEKLRDLVGMLTGKPVKNPMYQRYAIGDRVKYFNQDVGEWDVGVVTSVRNRNTYTVQNPDYKSILADWNELKPSDD